MDILELIKSRRSIRKFTDQPVTDDMITRVIEAGIWAPSGLNNQPWKMAVIRDQEIKSQVAGLTHYSTCVLSANVLIAVFLDAALGYDRTKDVQSIGACLQNMLLMIHAQGLGAVWLGEILKNKDKVKAIVQGSDDLELMAVLALGYPVSAGGKGNRRDIAETVFFSK
jgi:nitroreductase